MQSGINPKWERDWQKFRSSRETSRQLSGGILEELEYFSRRGEPLRLYANSFSNPVPGQEEWEKAGIDQVLIQYAAFASLALEMKGIDDGVFDSALSQDAFAASYTEEYMRMLRDHRFRPRYAGQVPHPNSPRYVFFTALGFVAGCREHASILAHLQLLAQRRGQYESLSSHVVESLLLAVLADFLDEPRPADISHDPLVSALLAVWRNDDPESIRAACIAVCDACTWTNVLFRLNRTPIALLLVLRLRTLLGLSNPLLDHPLMNSALGQLPAEIPFAASGVINRVRSRLAKQGYDERTIFNEVYDGPRKSTLLANFPATDFPTRASAAASPAAQKKKRRLGIHPSWQVHWNTSRALFETDRAEKDAKNRRALQNYANATPDRNQRWLDNDLQIYANARLMELEIGSVDGAPFNVDLALSAFHAARLEQSLAIAMHKRDTLGKNCRKFSYQMIPFTALGLVLGRHDEAFDLAREQFLARRHGYFPGAVCPYPIFNFMLRLLCDYLDEGPLFFQPDQTPQNLFNDLFAIWRTEDPAALISLCEAACDFHTRRAEGTGKPGDNMEFCNGKWLRYPIELLLLFKLRTMLGLPNPLINHPLMATALGRLPAATQAVPDPLLEQVRRRMILEELCSSRS